MQASAETPVEYDLSLRPQADEILRSELVAILAENSTNRTWRGDEDVLMTM